MKYCTQCGAPCEDRALFCNACGNKLDHGIPPQQATPPQQDVPPQQATPPQQGVPPQQATPPQPQYVPPQGGPQGYPGPYPGAMPPRPVAASVHTPLVQELTSPVLTALAILLSASILFGFIQLCFGSWLALFSMVPAILGIIGLWMLFSGIQNYRTRGTPIPLASFPLFKASMITSIVLNGISVLVIDIFLIIAMAEVGSLYYYYYGGGVMAILVLTFLFFTAFEVLAIVYYAKGLHVITDIRVSLETGQPVKPLSMFFIVVSFIIGICGVLGGIYMMVIVGNFYGPYFYGGMAAASLGFISALASAGFYILLGVSLSKLRKQSFGVPPHVPGK